MWRPPHYKMQDASCVGVVQSCAVWCGHGNRTCECVLRIHLYVSAIALWMWIWEMGSSPLTAIGHANANCAYVAANDFSIPCYKNQNKFVENKFVENKFVKHKFVKKKKKKSRKKNYRYLPVFCYCCCCYIRWLSFHHTIKIAK